MLSFAIAAALLLILTVAAFILRARDRDAAQQFTLERDQARSELTAIKARHDLLEAALNESRERERQTLEQKARFQSEAQHADARLAQLLAAKDDQITQLRTFIQSARDEFKAVSSEGLQKAAEQLRSSTTADVEMRREQIASMLKPVEDTMVRLDKHIEETNKDRARAEALLNEQVQRLAGASESLTTALRKPVVRGSWGEMTLENALESAGLEAGIDFTLQHTTDADDIARRSDAVIHLPKGRKLVIDSKNLMESFLAFSAEAEPTRKAILADKHARSLRAHIRSLSDKEYWKRYGGLDCVILFIPHDGMYHAAIRDEAELIREACDRRVFIANPMSLIPLLKAIRYVLDQERLNQSAAEISKVGADLYGDISRLADRLSTLGDKLRGTVKAYNETIPTLDRSIISKSRRLKQLGAARGNDPELPEALEPELRPFASRELQGMNAVTEADEVWTE